MALYPSSNGNLQTNDVCRVRLEPVFNVSKMRPASLAARQELLACALDDCQVVEVVGGAKVHHALPDGHQRFECGCLFT